MKNCAMALIGCLFILVLSYCQGVDPQETVATESTPLSFLEFKPEASKAIGKKIVLVSGDEEYRSEEALPQLAKILTRQHGFDCTVHFAQDPDRIGEVDPNYQNNIPGLSQLDDADLLILFTRFRALPDSQMIYFQKYLAAGKPVIGIRTSTHAFAYKDTNHSYVQWGNGYREEGSPWQGGFGRLVLGERWFSHHGHHRHQSTRGIFVDGEEEHPILRGIASGELWGATDVYGVRLPLPGDAQPLVLGQVIDRAGEYDENDLLYGMKETDDQVATVNEANKNVENPNQPMMPIVWLKTYQIPDGKSGRAFTSTLGASTDLLGESVRRLFVNASYYLLGMEVPAKASVATEGNFAPTSFSFKSDGYWDSLATQITSLAD